MESLKASGRKPLLVTGRHLDDLRRVFPDIELFDRVVAENGAEDSQSIRLKLTLYLPPLDSVGLRMSRRERTSYLNRNNIR